MTTLKASSLALVLLLLAGCRPVVYTVSGPLPVIERQPVPTIEASELECLSDETWLRLVERDARKEAHIRLLERLIEAHNEHTK